MKCPVCSAHTTTRFLVRSNIPVHQNLLYRSLKAAQQAVRGDLVLRRCPHCDFVFNSSFNQSLLSYGSDYENTQMHSKYFARHIQSLLRYFVGKRQATHKRIVEVGCGEGYFLRLLCTQGKNVGVGFDPAYQGPLSVADGRIIFHRSFFNPRLLQEVPDVIVCRHLIEHIISPRKFLEELKTISKQFSGWMFFETPSLEWILQHHAFWDFFYEHSSYFCQRSLEVLFAEAGFRVMSCQSVFGGQYFWIEIAGAQGISNESKHKRIPNAWFASYQDKENELVRYWRERIEKIKKNGRVALWGAAAKGTTFVNLIDPDRVLIDCIVDLNPRKQGMFIPGTGHRIISYAELLKQGGIQSVFVMNRNYYREIKDLTRRSKLKLFCL